ncbi:class I SAM-dependent methyltransferase [Endozoicomonas atrinae]|uniref:class I SAM-dependent methyltransferase n=1 Tax=Endozoicomonas atrinae TaxID=1333660 RepID=UPI0023781235|nr:class I SAM-dependent methyltransferase [Endozoicomonas atrinae]
MSQQFLMEQGFQTGMNCLDAGCGAGEISGRLLTLTGSNGSVTGIDIDPESIEMAKKKFAGQKNINFKSFNLEHIQTDQFDAQFDIIYCRFILCHLTNPLALLKKLKKILKSNGVIIVEDIDSNGCFTIPKDPDQDLFIQLSTQSMLLRNGNPYIGAQLHELFQSAGLQIGDLRCHQLTGSKGDCKTFWLQTFQCMRTSFINDGLISEPECNQLFTALEKFCSNPDTLIALPRCILISGSSSQGSALPDLQ